MTHVNLATQANRQQVFECLTRGQYQALRTPDVEIALNKADFSTAIDALHLAKDTSQGIVSQFVQIEVEGATHKVLVRNATGMRAEPGLDSFHSFAIMGLNYIRAARTLLGLHGHVLTAQQNQYLIKIAQHFYQEVSQTIDPEAALSRVLYQGILPFLRDELSPRSSKAKILKKLLAARDFGNFEQETFSVATTTRIPLQPGLQVLAAFSDKQTVDVMQVDMTMSGLTDTQQQQYTTLADTTIADEDQRLQAIDWYRIQKPEVKKLIRKYAVEILNGKTIPTQLRKHLAGLRNAGEERVYLIDERVSQQIYAGYHSGTPGHLMGNSTANQAATNETIAQLKKLTGAEHLCVHTLLSPKNPAAEDKKLSSQIKRAVAQPDQDNLHYSNTPLNIWRRVHPLDREGIEFIHQQATIILNNPLIPGVRKQKLTELMNALLRVLDGAHFFDPENKNLTLASICKNIVNQINELQPNKIAHASSCQSGKDREGLVRFKTTSDAVLLGITGQMSNNDPAFARQAAIIRQQLALSGQLRKQPGLNGGTLGAEGIKSDTRPAIPKSWGDGRTPLIEKTASFNKKMPLHFDQHQPWYKSKKFWLASAALVIALSLAATGIGALTLGIAATTMVSATAIAGGALFIGGSGAMCAASRKQNTVAPQKPWYKSGVFWGAVGALVLGGALCATGIGAVAGLAIAAHAVTMLASVFLVKTALITMGALTCGSLLTSIPLYVFAKRQHALYKRAATAGANPYPALLAARHDFAPEPPADAQLVMQHDVGHIGERLGAGVGTYVPGTHQDVAENPLVSAQAADLDNLTTGLHLGSASNPTFAPR